jgi:hypothetical protein
MNQEVIAYACGTLMLLAGLIPPAIYLYDTLTSW